MTQFKAKDPSIEVNGAVVLTFLESHPLFKDIFMEILAVHGIENPNVENWFILQNLLDAFEEMCKKTDGTTMRLIGNTIPKVAHWPLGVDSISAAMQTLDTAYHMNHRGGEIGHYAFSQKEENSGMFTCDNPYPCDFDMGIIEGLSYLIKDENISIQITHDEGACRKDGFEDCVYWVTWKKC